MREYITNHFKKGIMLSAILLMLGLLSFIGISSFGKSEAREIVNVEADDFGEVKLTADTVNKTTAPMTPTKDSLGTAYNAQYWYCDITTANPGVEGFTLGANECILTNVRTTRYGWHVGSCTFNISLPDKVVSNNVTYTVVGISSNFCGLHFCDHYWGSDDHWVSMYFNYMKLPSTIRYIGNNAFINTSWGGATADTRYDLSACNQLEYVGNNAFGGDSDRGEIIAIAPSQPKLKVIGDKAFKNAWVHYYEENETIAAPILKKIGDEAFYGCTGLKKLNLEANTVLETIGQSAFEACTNIETMNLSLTVTEIGKAAFKDTSLTNVTMASDVLSESIFEGCSSLTEINIADDIITKVPKRAFFGCQEFKTDYICKNATYIGDEAFYHVGFDSFDVGDNCVSIGNKAFGNNKESLRQINLNQVQTIGDYAFFECQQLVNVTIPSTVTTMGEHVFEDCIELESVTFNVNKLNAYMFNGCTALKTVTFNGGGSDIEVIPDYCFNNCSSLSTLSIITTESATLEEIGAYAFNNTAFPSISLTLNQNTIGANAFSNMNSLYSVVLDVDNISTRMFYGSTSLNTVTIKSGVQNVGGIDVEDLSQIPVDKRKFGAFQDCTALITITIENAVMGDYMFDGCTALKTITIPSTVDTIGEHALSNCTNLSSVTLNNNVLGASMFENDQKLFTISLSNSLTEIPTRAFYSSYLTSVTIPATVEVVGDEAFAQSKHLASVTLNNNVIGEKMFMGCSAITTMVIPACASDKVGDYAFQDCTGLATIDISNATTIGVGMFKGCDALGGPESYVLTIPSSVTTIGKEAFMDCGVLHDVINNSQIYSEEMFRDCIYLSEIVINENVTTIGKNTFMGCLNLSKATIKCAITSEGMFRDCKNSLTTVSFALDENATNKTANVEFIAKEMFQNCKALSTIDIDYGTITSIGEYAFQNCTSLENLTINASVRSMGEGVFSGCSKLSTIYIPFVGQARCTNANQAASDQSTFGWIFGDVNPSLVNTAQGVQVDETIAAKFNEITFQYGENESTSSYKTYLPKTLTQVTILDETVIQYGAFSNLTVGSTVIIEENASKTTQTLQDYAFYNADSLTRITLNAHITNIGEYVFAECNNISYVMINGNTLGNYMFQNNIKLEEVHIKNVNMHLMDA